jgi:hypothetical protein
MEHVVHQNQEDMVMSKIITKVKKQKILGILNQHGYLTNYDIKVLDDPDFLKASMKIPFSWLLNAYCINTTQTGKDGLKNLEKVETFDLRLVEQNNSSFLETFCEPASGILNIRYTKEFINNQGYDLQIKRSEGNRDKVSKAELYEIIRTVFPQYCPSDGCLAPIRAAHRDWYVVILFLACTNAVNHCPMSHNGCKLLIKNFRERKIRKSRKICEKTPKNEKKKT